MQESTEVGHVYLVGAGPGDPGLLTLKGQRCLQMADVVLYDGLVNPLLLAHTSASAERTCRTSLPGGRQLQQEAINERLIEAAKSGKTVVRLKGGDPFMFGRGSEEAAALVAAGIPFEVVPGITAATAAGAYAGISLTHRQHASSVAFVTGHEDPTKEESSLDYQNLADFPGTLVFYMGLHRLPVIADSLLLAGKDPQTPACVMSRATTPLQRTITAPLVDLADAVRSAELHAPSLIIIGDCVTQRESIAWYEHLPLFGKRIGITRPEHQAENAVQMALDLGGQPVLLPTIEITPPDSWEEIDNAITRLLEFDWIIFTSVNGVRGFLNRIWETGGDMRQLGNAKFACIGPSTAEALAAYQIRADIIPESYRAEALAKALQPLVNEQKVLWAGANIGRDVLITKLKAAGAIVEKIAVYNNNDTTSFTAEQQELLNAGELDWIGLSSPSIARNFASLLTDELREHLGTKTKLATISPVTTAAAEEAGLPVAAEAEVYTWTGIFTAISRNENSLG